LDIKLAGGKGDQPYAALDYSIEHAKQIKSWPELEQAVDLKGIRCGTV
jgi:hypothetical protein